VGILVKLFVSFIFGGKNFSVVTCDGGWRQYKEHWNQGLLEYYFRE
jgi:hypothetical protein